MTGPEPDELTAAALAARSGDRDALQVFLRQAQGPVWRFCAHMVPTQDTDDLTQEVFLRAWRSLGGFQGDAQVLTWLLTIARRVCIESVTRASRQSGKQPGQPPAPGPGWAPDPAGAQALTDLIEHLEPDRREAFVLTQLIGLSYAETAAVAGCEIGTIRSRVSRARVELIDELGNFKGTNGH